MFKARRPGGGSAGLAQATESLDAAYAALLPRPSRWRAVAVGIVLAALAAAAWFSPHFARPSLLSGDRQGYSHSLAGGRFVLTGEQLRASGAPTVTLRKVANPGEVELLGVWVLDGDQEGRLAMALWDGGFSEVDAADAAGMIERLEAAGAPLSAATEPPAKIGAGQSGWLVLLWRAPPRCGNASAEQFLDLSLAGIGPVTRTERFNLLAEPTTCFQDSDL
ncbi:MAG: hypothetical protein LBC97_13470 [Bifidobacteriaceae bacterium]|jgi:hypothetical protein|nr:hypothetical protein [Bifidobacteriaceae bacterium]